MSEKFDSSIAISISSFTSWENFKHASRSFGGNLFFGRFRKYFVVYNKAEVYEMERILLVNFLYT